MSVAYVSLVQTIPRNGVYNCTTFLCNFLYYDSRFETISMILPHASRLVMSVG